MNKKVLLTGASGFIGRHVLDCLLNKGYEVFAVYNSTKPTEREGLNAVQLDLFDYDTVKAFFAKEKFENLIHLAWFTGKKCHSTNANLDWVCASINLLKCFNEQFETDDVENLTKKVLMAGTVSEYDFSYGYLTEGLTPLNNPSLYGKCKASLYNMAEQYSIQNGIEFKWARVFNLYGPYEKETRLMPYVMNAMLNGEDVKVSPCTKVQDYSHVFDTAAAIVKFFESDVQGAVNICSGKPIKLKNIVEKIKELTDFKGNILYGAIPAKFEEPFVVGNNARLVNEVGYSAKYDLEEGLKDTIEWWKEYKHV